MRQDFVAPILASGSFDNLCEAQTETCKGVLLILQMDDLAAEKAS